jgi:hypothetical protein
MPVGTLVATDMRAAMQALKQALKWAFHNKVRPGEQCILIFAPSAT